MGNGGFIKLNSHLPPLLTRVSVPGVSLKFHMLDFGDHDHLDRNGQSNYIMYNLGNDKVKFVALKNTVEQKKTRQIGNHCEDHNRIDNGF